VSKAAGKLPSSLLGINEWASELTGMDDTWTALQFDNAVTLFGRFIENKLEETDSKGKYVNKLSDLLDDKPRTIQDFAKQFGGLKGAVSVKKAKV
jgi:hypothetical protein